MLKPSFRYFIIPLGAISTLATLSAQQNVTPRAQRDTGSMYVRRAGRGLRHEISHGGLRDLLRQRDLSLSHFYRPNLLDLPSYLQRPGRDAPQPGRSAFAATFRTISLPTCN